GFLPIAVLGLSGYIAIGAAWVVARWSRPPWANLAQLALAGMVWFGVAFSIYLTFLEPFVIGATCAWCLTSAVIMTALLWLVAPLLRPAAVAVRSLATHS
ncbi:MAG: vitamin K epoxide reductase family protein, partial [Anaerolineae bacterium]|nr:vitamin K epoxide reductase family protein [Anaerolineae bacterium]